MSLSRRDLMKVTGALPIAAALPGTPVVQRPAVIAGTTIVAGNTLITPSMIGREALAALKYNLVLSERIHREYKKEFTGS